MRQPADNQTLPAALQELQPVRAATAVICCTQLVLLDHLMKDVESMHWAVKTLIHAPANCYQHHLFCSVGYAVKNDFVCC